MFQLRSCLTTLHNGIHCLKIDILSILNQMSVICSQKLTLALLNPLDLTSLIIRLEAKIISHPRLALPEWDGENIWYMYKLMKLQSFMMSDTLYVVLHIPLIDKSLQFHFFRIHNIPLVHLTLQKSFQYAIQEEYLAIRLDGQYILFPLSTDIMSYQISNGQFHCINTPYVRHFKVCSYALFLQNKDNIITFCTLSVINQTHDKAVNINNNFWAISTLQNYKKLYIACLQFSYSQALCFPYDIIYLLDRCKVSAITFVLPSKN